MNKLLRELHRLCDFESVLTEGLKSFRGLSSEYMGDIFLEMKTRGSFIDLH